MGLDVGGDEDHAPIERGLAVVDLGEQRRAGKRFVRGIQREALVGVVAPELAGRRVKHGGAEAGGKRRLLGPRGGGQPRLVEGVSRRGERDQREPEKSLHRQSPKCAWMSASAATAAVSARRMRGPRLSRNTRGRRPICARSSSSKPPSGPISSPTPGAGGAAASAASGLATAASSSQNTNRWSAGHCASAADNGCGANTSGRQRIPHC